MKTLLKILAGGFILYALIAILSWNLLEAEWAVASFGIIFPVISVTMVALSVALWVVCLLHAIKNPLLNDTQKLMWIIVLVFTNIIGAIIYAYAAPIAKASASAC